MVLSRAAGKVKWRNAGFQSAQRSRIMPRPEKADPLQGDLNIRQPSLSGKGLAIRILRRGTFVPQYLT